MRGENDLLSIYFDRIRASIPLDVGHRGFLFWRNAGSAPGFAYRGLRYYSAAYWMHSLFVPSFNR